MTITKVSQRVRSRVALLPLMRNCVRRFVFQYMVIVCLVVFLYFIFLLFRFEIVLAHAEAWKETLNEIE